MATLNSEERNLTQTPEPNPEYPNDAPSITPKSYKLLDK